MTEWLFLLLALGLIAACGAFVAAEFSFITVDRAAVEQAATAGDKRAQGTLSALRSLSTQLSGAQLGITITNLAIGFLAEPAIAEIVDGPLLRAGLSDTGATTVSVAIALILATSLTMVFGELVPKNLAIAKPLPTARAVQGFQRGFTTAMAWPIRFLNGTANAILRAIGVEPSEELASARSPQELASLVARSAQEGTLATSTAALVQRSLVFGERRARDVLTPRPQMATLPVRASITDMIDLSALTGHSRFPVVGDSGEIVGVVHVRRAAAVPYEDRDSVPVTEILRPPVMVPESMQLDTLMETLKEGGLQLAVVVDEFGSVDGIVTLEDLIEEIVGEVVDEHDDEPEDSSREPDGSWVLSALLRPDEAGRILGTVFPESEEFESMGGLITVALDRFPVVGDRVTVSTTAPVHETVDAEAPPAVTRWELIVRSMDGHRVDRIQAVGVQVPDE